MATDRPPAGQNTFRLDQSISDFDLERTRVASGSRVKPHATCRPVVPAVRSAYNSRISPPEDPTVASSLLALLDDIATFLDDVAAMRRSPPRRPSG